MLANSLMEVADKKNQLLWKEHKSEMVERLLWVCTTAAERGMYRVELTVDQCPFFGLLLDYGGEFFVRNLASEVESEGLSFYFYDKPGRPRRIWASWNGANVWKA